MSHTRVVFLGVAKTRAKLFLFLGRSVRASEFWMGEAIGMTLYEATLFVSVPLVYDPPLAKVKHLSIVIK